MCIYLGQVDPRSLLHFQELLPTMSTNTPSNPEDHVPLPVAPEETVGAQSSESEPSDPPENLSDPVLPAVPKETVGAQSSESELSDPPEYLSDPVLPAVPEETVGAQSSEYELLDPPESSVDEGKEEDLDDDTENDAFHHSYHNPPDPESNVSGAGASATGTTVSNTQEIDYHSDPCGNCSAPSSLDCVCRDMRYCSPECLAAHKRQHEDICYAFRTQRPRPNDLHHRGILLPHNSRDLRFVWIFSESMLSNFGLSELAPLAGITHVTDTTKGRWGGNDRQLSIIGWQQNHFNRSLSYLLGWESKVWRGTVLVKAFVEQEIEPLESGVHEDEGTTQVRTKRVPVDAGTRDVEGFLRYCHLFRREIE